MTKTCEQSIDQDCYDLDSEGLLPSLNPALFYSGNPYGNGAQMDVVNAEAEDTCEVPAAQTSVSSRASDTSVAPKEPQTVEDLLSAKVDPQRKIWRKMTPFEEAMHSLDQTVGSVLGLDSPGEGEDGYATSVNGETFVYEAAGESGSFANKDLVGPNAQQFIGRAFVVGGEGSGDRSAQGGGPKKVATLTPDGKLVYTDPENDKGMVELPGVSKDEAQRPTPFLGYKAYYHNDIKNKGKGAKGDQKDQFGSAEQIAKTINLSLDYQTLFPDSCLDIGDLSTDRGKSPYINHGDDATHHTHVDGTQFDVRYVQGKESQKVANGKSPVMTKDDLLRTQALVTLGEGDGFNQFYMSSALKGKIKLGKGSTPLYTGHENHMHIGYQPPPKPPAPKVPKKPKKAAPKKA